MSILINKIKGVYRQIGKAILLRIERLREKLGGYLNVYPIYKGLVYTKQEEGLISKSVELIRAFFPENPGQCLLSEDYESRCEAIEDVGYQLIECYGLEGVEIVITEDAERFPPERSTCLYGYASMSENKIYINANFLSVDDEQVLRHMVSTVIHELRHMMQFHIMSLRNTYGVPYDRRHLWRSNMTQYIEPEYDPEGYLKQPIEYDARNYANRVWRDLYGEEVS